MRHFQFGYLVFVLGLCGCLAMADRPKLSASHCEVDEAAPIGPLIATRYPNLQALETTVQITYHADGVTITQCSNGTAIQSSLSQGVSEKDFRIARDSGLVERVSLAIRSPYALFQLGDLKRIFVLSRRKQKVFGAGSVAFYDFGERMTQHIVSSHRNQIAEDDWGEKGFLNTFNHVTAQAFVTAIYDETMAEYVADVHERYNMPELITGDFKPKQLTSPTNNPVDNYVDMINNEWGQQLGMRLKAELEIGRNTVWTPVLLADFLNELQCFYAWSLGVRFAPFEADDDEVIRFSKKLNLVLHEGVGID
jgi:hypothetical protein